MSDIHYNKLLVAGNWKMNNSLEEAVTLVLNLQSKIDEQSDVLERADFLVCPSSAHIAPVLQAGTSVPVGGQDCSAHDNGAHTGDISAAMLSDLGCSSVILGHSERRQDHLEASALIRAKAERAISEGLNIIICVGETLEERENGLANEVVSQQLLESIPFEIVNAQNLVVAYEPVWAIGTGKVASPEDVQSMHAHIASFLKEKLDMGPSIRILYGGSVKPNNAGALSQIEHVDGFLVGGASLDAESFFGIADAIK